MMNSSERSGTQSTRGRFISDGRTTPSCRVPGGNDADAGHMAVWGGKGANY